MDREYHSPDEQCASSCLVYFDCLERLDRRWATPSNRTSWQGPLPFLKSGSGSLRFVRSCVDCRGPGSSRVQAAKLRRTRRRCLVDEVLQWVEWERLSRTCVAVACLPLPLPDSLTIVPPNVTFRCHPRWCRGCSGRSWCPTGNSQDTKRCTSVNDCKYKRVLMYPLCTWMLVLVVALS